MGGEALGPAKAVPPSAGECQGGEAERGGLGRGNTLIEEGEGDGMGAYGQETGKGNNNI